MPRADLRVFCPGTDCIRYSKHHHLNGHFAQQDTSRKAVSSLQTILYIHHTFIKIIAFKIIIFIT
ncbi:MAG TPA: hypothetical protein DIT07_12385 [Sphingobacteriaceae bacterium]|nr:hypothetical protein [Sphingobacteriaceae bacterium]